MNGQNCCSYGADRPAAGDPPTPQRRHSFIQRCVSAIRWITPGALLVLMPKCPVCLATYVALGTGIGLSVPTARYLRIILIILCVGSLLYLLFKRVWPHIRRTRTTAH